MTVFLLIAALTAIAALALHHHHWRRGASAQHVLVALPPALLFVILPVPLLMFTTIRAFKDIGERGVNSYSTVGTLSADINRALWLGSLGVLITMLIAAVLQWRASSASVEEPAASQRTPREWVLLACALLLVPAALLFYTAGEVPRTLMGAMEMMTGGAGSRVSPSELGDLSAKISALLVAGFLGGLALAVIGLFAAGGALAAAHAIRQPQRPMPAAWVLLAIAIAGAAWNALQLPVERRWIERITAVAAQRNR